MKGESLVSIEKPVVMILALLLSSCYSYKSINKNEPITRENLSKLDLGGTYLFDLKAGEPFYVQVTNIKADTIVGVMHGKNKSEFLNYSESFETIQRNVVKISLRRRDTTLTVFAIAVPAALTFGVIAHSINSWFDSTWQ